VAVSDKATLHLNPDPIGTFTSNGCEHPTYPDNSCFIYATTARIEVEVLRAECTCGECAEERPDTAAGRCALLDFAQAHARSCGFPEDALRARLP
jgi:hypothetical protein